MAGSNRLSLNLTKSLEKGCYGTPAFSQANIIAMTQISKPKFTAMKKSPFIWLLNFLCLIGISIAALGQDIDISQLTSSPLASPPLFRLSIPSTSQSKGHIGGHE